MLALAGLPLRGLIIHEKAARDYLTEAMQSPRFPTDMRYWGRARQRLASVT
jgi:hypothetical protein